MSDPKHPEILSPDVIRQRRRGGWRQKVWDEVGKISPVVAKGLMVHFNKRADVNAGKQALNSLTDSERSAIWRGAFPGIAEVVELAWTHLSAQTIARKDGGSSGNGEPFFWKLENQEADHFKFEWLRKLLIVTGPFPELDFPGVIRHLALIGGGSMEESDADYRETSGHSYDTDAPAYAASVLLSRQPDSAMAKEVVEILEGQLIGTLPYGTIRAICTSWLCTDRPDLWRKMNTCLAESAAAPGFTGSLLSFRVGCQPGAWIDLLQTIRDQRLLRLQLVNDWTRQAFLAKWHWKSTRRDDVQPWLDRWVRMIESESAREEAFNGSDPGDYLLALWGEALHDGDAAVSRISDPSLMAVEIRIAAVHFLEICPPKRRKSLILTYATDPDLRVSSIAAGMLTGYGSIVPDATEVPAVFERFHQYLTALPAVPVAPPIPTPFPQRPLNFDGLSEAIARMFPDGVEDIIESLLPKMGTSARDAVVQRLNRYTRVDQDRAIAKIINGRDPQEWERWLKDNEGSQTYRQRLLLLKMMADRSTEVAEHAYKAAKKFTLSKDEAVILRPILATKNAKKHLFVTQFLSNQPEPLLAGLIPDYLFSKKAGERLAALEILRRLTTDETKVSFARSLWRETGYQPKSDDEERALRVLCDALGPDDPDSLPSLDNAFGLVDPHRLATPLEPQDRNTPLHSPVTERLVQGLDQWLVSHGETMIPSTQSWRSTEPERLADVTIPYSYGHQSIEENLLRFPPAPDLAEWWDTRPPEMRDADGFELIRLRLTLAESEGKRPSVIKVLFGLDGQIPTQSKKQNLLHLVAWINLLRPEEESRGDWMNYLIDATEAAYVRLAPKEKQWSRIWHRQVEERLVRKDDTPDEIMARLWKLARNRNRDSDNPFAYEIYDVARFHQRGIASDEEVLWKLIGPRKFKDKYDRRNAFSFLASVSQPPPAFKMPVHALKFQKIVHRVCDRIVELELTRGEAPEVWSYAALSIQQLKGSSNLVRCLKALGILPLVRKQRRISSDDPDVTRPAVLLRLLSVCHPDENDTPEEFKRLVRDAAISTERLLEIALFRPAWTDFIEQATGIHGLRDAVGWIFAHTRSIDYVWQSQSRELWAGELNFQTAILPEDFLAGAVDPDWFARAYNSVGKEIWSRLYDAAKFASTGKGHTRARLFSDALTDRVTVEDLQKALEEKGNLDAAPALGLPSLPTSKKARTVELLRRYGILQALRKRSLKSKAQRAASEQTAFEMGVRNLARRAGFSDTLRFEWAMETEAVADFGTLNTTIDGIKLTVEITPSGTLELNASRSGQTVSTLPSAVKKHPDYLVLRDRMSTLKQQAARLRPSLEGLMMRGVVLTSGEWQNLLRHPLAGPLLERLILATESGIMGFPTQSGLCGLESQLTPWPPEAMELHLAHPVDFLPAEQWHLW